MVAGGVPEGSRRHGTSRHGAGPAECSPRAAVCQASLFVCERSRRFNVVVPIAVDVVVGVAEFLSGDIVTEVEVPMRSTISRNR